MEVEYKYRRCKFCSIKVGDVFLEPYGSKYTLDSIYMRVEPCRTVSDDTDRINAVNVITGDLAYFNDLDVVIPCDDARICIGHTD